MKTALTSDSDEAIFFGKRAFQVVVREIVKAIFCAAVFWGIIKLCYHFLGEDSAFIARTIFGAMALGGIPMMFADGVKGGIADVLVGRVEKKFLGFGPEPTNK